MALSALTLDDALSNSVKKRLFAEKILTLAHFDDLTPTLMPRTPQLAAKVAEIRKKLDPSILIESLCFYKKPPNTSPVWTRLEKTRLINGIAALSTLAGLRYYSPSRKKTRTFYQTSRVVKSPDDTRPIPDPTFTKNNLPTNLTLYAAQTDLTFDENIYRFDCLLADNLFLISQANVTTMYYGILPVLKRGALQTVIALMNCEDYILIYMTAMADAISLPGMKGRVAKSFESRASALIGWFKAKADAVYEDNKSTNNTTNTEEKGDNSEKQGN
jgi:hypothetical protein